MKRFGVSTTISVVMMLLFCVLDVSGEIPVDVSCDGALILTTTVRHRGLSLVDRSAGTELQIADFTGSGYYASISPGNQFVCFKEIVEGQDGVRLHTPALFDIGTCKKIALAEASRFAGVPAISENGNIAFTVGNTLTVMNRGFEVVGVFDLGHHVNIPAFSPDGTRLAYNTPDEQISVMELNGECKVLTGGNGSYWNPQFSPSGTQLLAQTVDGRIVCINLAAGTSAEIGKGLNPAWLDEDSIAFTRRVSNGREVVKTELCMVGPAGDDQGSFVMNEGDAEVVVKGYYLAISQGEGLKLGILSGSNVTITSSMAGKGASTSSSEEFFEPQSLTLDGNTVYITGVPTVHQVYDTPEWFNGHWACGASAASMALAYYGCFNNWDCWCMEPYSHYSHYGPYICDTYTYNGMTFDIVETDPDGEYSTGGYGYITQNDWEDTKTHMAEYIQYHGPSSYVDWSPTFAKACSETDNSYPYVLLNSLTSAGHYITGIGYYTEQYSLIFNDPYGNKNTEGYPSYDGTEVTYDWPGYDYGNENLNTVHCYIYARYTIQPTPTPTPTLTEVIVDNASADCTLSGSWSASTSVRGWYASDYAVASNKSSSLATFYLNIPTEGIYDVFAYWTSSSDRSGQAPYTITYDGGSDTVSKDQTNWGGRFQLLGSYPFNAGQYTIDLSTNTGEVGREKYVIADAVKAVIPGEPVPTPTPTPTPTPQPTPTPGTDVIVDNDMGEPMYTETGTWYTSSSSGYDGGTYRYCYGGDSSTATWTAPLSETGYYDLYAIYRQSTNRVTSAKYDVAASGGTETVYISQNGDNVLVSTLLGRFHFNAGDNSVTLDAAGSSPTGDAVIADAMQFTLASEPTPTPTPEPSVYIYVHDIAMSWGSAGPNYFAYATVWIKDDSGVDVEGATVYGDWSDATNESQSGVTGADGKATFESSKKRNGGTFTFTVTDVVKDGYTYDPGLNNETSDSITCP